MNWMALLVVTALQAACWTAVAEEPSRADAVLHIQSPCEITPNTEEPGRAGSGSAFRVRNCSSGKIRLVEVLLFTEESIHKFDDQCARRTGHTDDDSCWESPWRPRVEDLRSERKALDSGAALEGYERIQINDVPFLVHEVTIASSKLTLREYATYQGERRLTIWVEIEPDVRSADRRVADRLAGMLTINAPPAR